MKNRKGFILPLAVMVFVLLLIIVPVMVRWVQDDTKMSVKDQKASVAFNMAEAAVDRGYWKAKSSTTTFSSIMAGIPLGGYNFDATYRDISGGIYRINLSSGPGQHELTITGEGKDLNSKETRALKAVFSNHTIYSPIITNGNFTAKEMLAAFWGPIMAQGNYDMINGYVAKRYFPRKYARGVVTGQGSYTRDVNGLTPPNTDGEEWWSDYEYVPELPVLDTDLLKASATATGTYNRYDLKSSFGSNTCKNTNAPAPPLGPGSPYSICKKFPNQPSDDSGPNLTWYWDGDVRLEGYENNGDCSPYTSSNKNYSFKGKLIVMGNLTINGSGCYKFTDSVPAEAWRDHTKLDKTTWDTTATMEYPADTGLHQNKIIFNYGTELFRPYPGLDADYHHTVGMRGFTYVRGILDIIGPNGYMDFIGAVWIVGDVTSSGGSGGGFCGVFFDDKLDVPTLNVVLIRQSWQETAPNTAAWI
jgi:hypothetical protein